MKRNWSSYLCITKSRCRVSDKWLGLRFLMSDEDRKVFVIAGYIHFLTCFSLTWHLSALTLPFLFPFPLYFFLTDTWLQFTHCYLLRSLLLPVLFTFLAPIYFLRLLFAFFARKKWCFLYAWNIIMQKTLLSIPYLMNKMKFSAE